MPSLQFIFQRQNQQNQIGANDAQQQTFSFYYIFVPSYNNISKDSLLQLNVASAAVSFVVALVRNLCPSLARSLAPIYSSQKKNKIDLLFY